MLQSGSPLLYRTQTFICIYTSYLCMFLPSICMCNLPQPSSAAWAAVLWLLSVYIGFLIRFFVLSKFAFTSHSNRYHAVIGQWYVYTQASNTHGCTAIETNTRKPLPINKILYIHRQTGFCWNFLFGVCERATKREREIFISVRRWKNKNTQYENWESEMSERCEEKEWIFTSIG